MLKQYFAALLTTAITHAGLSLFVYLKGSRRLTNITYTGYSMAIAIWSAFEAFAITRTDQNLAFWLWRINHMGVIFIPIFFVHFVISLFSSQERHRSQILIFASYLVGLIFSVLNITGLLMAGVEPKFHFNYFISPTPIYYLFFSLWVGWAVYGLFRLFQLYLHSGAAKRNQLSYFSISMLVAYIGGIPNFLPTFDIEIPLLMPFGTYAIAIYAFFTAYAIVTYRLMDIEVIIRRTLVFAGLLAFVFGVFSFGLFLTQEVLAAYFGFRSEIALAISIFLIVLGYEPMRAFLIETTDQFLFQKKYDYQKVLKDAALGIAQIESLHYLLRLVTHFITIRVRVKNAAVLILDLKTERYHLGYQRGYPPEFGGEAMLEPRNELIRYLEHEKEGIDIERVKEYIETGGKRRKRGGQVFQYDYAKIRQQMESLHAACSIPSFLGKDLRNILILGEKKSGDYYTDEDLNVLFALAQQSAVAIENARLYDEAINRSRELQKINEELEVAKVRLIQALEETEKANKQLQDTQAQLIHEQKMATLGRLAASVGHEVNNPLTILSMNVSRAILKYRKDPTLKVTDVADIFQKMEQNIGRIKAVVNTLTGLLKKSEKGKFEPLSLKLLLEETLPLVQFQTYLENPTGTEVEFDVPGSIPLIKGDLERLQEVFLNLFINAYHAMASRRERRILVEAHLANHDHKMVEINFKDNGCGMTEEVQKKIFTYGFTTKGPGRGSGMGLYICKYIIELHGGEIRVKSQSGVGTTFTLTLPAYEEPSQVALPSGGGYTTG